MVLGEAAFQQYMATKAAGVVSAIGSGVNSVVIGDSVVVTLIRACGTCISCASGAPTNCETPYDGDQGPIRTTSNTKLHQAMACGAFAEKVVVHQNQLVKIPETIAKDAASLIACGVITGVGAVVNAAALRAGQDVVVIGAGGRRSQRYSRRPDCRRKAYCSS